MPSRKRGNINDVVTILSQPTFVTHDPFNNKLIVDTNSLLNLGTYTIPWQASPSPTETGSFNLLIKENLNPPKFEYIISDVITVELGMVSFIDLPPIFDNDPTGVIDVSVIESPYDGFASVNFKKLIIAAFKQ